MPILVEFRTVGIAMKNSPIVREKAYPIGLLVAADLAGSNEFSLKVFCYHYIIFEDKIPVVQEAFPFFGIQVDGKIDPGGNRLGIGVIATFRAALNAGKSKCKGRTSPQTS